LASLSEQAARKPAARVVDPEALTARQIECLHWTARGKTAWETGQILGISRRTVEEHLAMACKSLGVRTKIQAALKARDAGLLDR
jgi:DNA-binding CsgD family transcriptional regulator